MRVHDEAVRRLVIAIELLLLSISLGAQIPTSVGDRQIDDIRLDSPDLEQALENFAYQKRVPIGLESLPANRITKRPLSLRLERVTVGQALDKLVAVDSRYHWRETGGVISVAPAPSDPLLDTRIERFEIKRKVKEAALGELCRTPELSAAFAKAGVRRRSFISIAGQVPDTDTKK